MVVNPGEPHSVAAAISGFLYFFGDTLIVSSEGITQQFNLLTGQVLQGIP